MKPRLLLVEDEIDLGNVVRQYLEVMEFTVDWLTDGQEAMDRLLAEPGAYQLLLIDVSLPGLNGFELASRLVQQQINTPFLFLTARNERADRLHGLKIGADDYVSKPFDIDELVLRIRNILRRQQQAGRPVAAPELPGAGNIRFEKQRLTLSVGDKVISLTPREAELLEYLFQHPNQVLKREDLLTQLWGVNDYFLGRSLDVFISRLRKHLGNNPYVTITNVYGVGFLLDVKEGR
ncbi:MAG: response regulator transcription factor [Candidatus Pseudobacter hemicellulosilyticus]|uniref:Response regulator transcription factor n=1 Tax=Candidatus Pseudobacter hemicellulosilyticus TaxID=3121375 RepID=A0AAJ5WRX0_9BACT|nr:MAG: response regulator transcription factor [Pseudobacter sp.]